MAQTVDVAAEAAVPEQQQRRIWRSRSRGSCRVRARDGGVWLVGPDGLLAGVTRTVLQAALTAAAGGRMSTWPGARSSA